MSGLKRLIVEGAPARCVGLASSLVFVVVALAYARTAPAQDLDVARIFREASSSVVLLIALDEHLQPLALGSGFFIDTEGAVATNYHVIEGARSIQARLPGREEVIEILGLLGTDTEKDLAILKVSTSQTRALPLSVVRPTIGERIVVIGNPLGLEASVSEGIVSGIRRVSEDFELYQITAPISPGSSGGPVLNARGEAIGVATLTLTAGQNLNFAVPTGELDDLRGRSTGDPKPVASSVEAPLTPMFDSGEGREPVRLVDTRKESMVVNGSVYNGTQLPIKNIHIRAVCFRQGVEVPIYFSDEIVERTIPPGLSTSFSVFCGMRATDFELRLLDYEIVREGGR